MKTALITGASTGIGFDFAKLFAEDACELILVSKNLNRLETAAEQLRREHHAKVTTISCDLTQPEAPNELYAQIKKLGVNVDYLVNNAGYGLHGQFTETDLQLELGMIQLNVTSLVHLTKLFARDMVIRKQGHILNVGSTAGFQPGPSMAIYYATKGFVLLFSEALREELKNTGVSVTVLCPGATETNFSKVAKMEKTRLFKGRVMDSQTVARKGYDGMMSGKSVVIPGFMNKLMAASVRFAPRNLVTTISARVVATT